MLSLLPLVMHQAIHISREIKQTPRSDSGGLIDALLHRHVRSFQICSAEQSDLQSIGDHLAYHQVTTKTHESSLLGEQADWSKSQLVLHPNVSVALWLVQLSGIKMLTTDKATKKKKKEPCRLFVTIQHIFWCRVLTPTLQLEPLK